MVHEKTMKEEVAIGLDVGTSGMKATAYMISDGLIVDNRTFQYTEPEILPGISRAHRYLEVTIGALRSLSEDFHVASVALSTQMYSFIAEMENEEVVYQWNYVCPDDADAYRILADSQEISGCPTASLFPSYKIQVARKLDPSLVVRPYGLQEYLTEKLTGLRVVDRCCASASGFRNVMDGTWNGEAVAAVGFASDAMPDVIEFNRPVGPITHEGLSDLAPIVFATGMGDGPSASYATYGISSLTANIGTSMAVRAFTHDLSGLDFSKVWTFEVTDGMWVAGAISSNGCAVLDKFRSQGILRDDIVDPATDDNSLMFFPWEHGERSPFWSGALKETLIGGHLGSTVDDYGAAILRGVAFTVTRMFDDVGGVGATGDMVCVAGGGAKSESLMSYLAGSVGVRVGLLEDFDYLGARGASYAAAEAVGAEVRRESEMHKIIEPTGRYEQVYSNWCRLADELADFYKRMD